MRSVWLTLRSSLGGRPLPRLSAALACSPKTSLTTSSAGRAFFISAAVHSGLSLSGRSAGSSSLFFIPSNLFLICLAEADDVHGIIPHCDDGGMQAFAQERQHTQP